jgi:hypothetical protein
LVIGLLQFVDGRMVARHLLQVADWRPDRIVAHVHRAVQPGDYGLAILHALPQSAQSVAGVFELASETLPVSIR